MKKDLSTYNRELFEFLKSANQPDLQALNRAQNVSAKESTRLDRTILTMGLLEEAVLMEFLAKHFELELVSAIENLHPETAAIDQLGTVYLKKNNAVPITGSNSGIIMLLSDPGNQQLIDDLGFSLDVPVRIKIATSKHIQSLLARQVEPDVATTSELSEEQNAVDIGRFREAASDGPIIKFVASKLNEAVDLTASDIHFESIETGLRIRYRINGILMPQPVDIALSPTSIFARLKVMAGMNVSERRLPQDGRMNITVSGRPVDFRVSSIPTQFGESIVCRVLDPKSLKLGWTELGFGQEISDLIKYLIEKPSGLFLVTGPTGSGKTTTLYTALAHLNDAKRKIITVEDPIEYNLAGIEQVQVHEEIGLTFARTLRSILRQDPNVIMIGEIRDQETAEIACRAALVGRMVLSTLHTNSAEGALPRLLDLGVPEYVVKDVLQGVLAQDLKVNACRQCDGKGCKGCGMTGVGERMLVAEMRLET